MVSDSGDRAQKTIYPDSETAEWVEELADENDRSESYVISKLLEGLAESVDYESIKLVNYNFSVEDKGSNK